MTEKQKKLLQLATEIVTKTSQDNADPNKITEYVKKNYEILRDLVKD